MGVSIHQLVAAVSPDVYCDQNRRREVKEQLARSMQVGDSMTYIRAAELAKPIGDEASAGRPERLGEPFSLEDLKCPSTRRTFSKDSMAESLEAFYFDLLGAIESEDRWAITKVIDTFEASNGSVVHPYFSRRAAESRDHAANLMQASRTLLQSILREHDKLNAQEETLRYYDELDSEDSKRRAIALAFLKQQWLESVEKRNGSMSLLRLSARFPHRELLRQFMDESSSGRQMSQEPTDWLDNTVLQRLESFARWLERSEQELKKRVAVDKTQLRQDLHRLKLQAGWLKPLLEQNAAASKSPTSNVSLVSGFNSMDFRLLILAVGPSSVEERVERAEFPRSFNRREFRPYHPVLVIEMEFRGTRNRQPGIRGRAEVRITSYGLSAGELAILRREAERQELGETILAIDSSAQDVVSGLVDMITEPPTKHPIGKSSFRPFNLIATWFSRLAGWLFGRPVKSLVRPDSHLEKVMRSAAIIDGKQIAESLFAQLKGSPHPEGRAQ